MRGGYSEWVTLAKGSHDKLRGTAATFPGIYKDIRILLQVPETHYYSHFVGKVVDRSLRDHILLSTSAVTLT
jgi:hypothetical protein